MDAKYLKVRGIFPDFLRRFAGFYPRSFPGALTSRRSESGIDLHLAREMLSAGL